MAMKRAQFGAALSAATVVSVAAGATDADRLG